MDWITGIQNAIDYVEDHLTEELDYEEIAKASCSSRFHFQRIFGILCGYTLGEYIRNRRLTLAGAELATTRAKVIDVAYKYGYENTESFSYENRKNRDALCVSCILTVRGWPRTRTWTSFWERA